MAVPKSSVTVEEYISDFPVEIQKRLNTIRKAVSDAAPDITEKISYGMPSFFRNGILLYFAAYKNHIGFYPLPAAIRTFKSELTQFKLSKGTIQFPNDQPLPLELIKKIIAFRIEENSARVISARRK